MSKTTNKFSPEVRHRAIRMVLDHEAERCRREDEGSRAGEPRDSSGQRDFAQSFGLFRHAELDRPFKR